MKADAKLFRDLCEHAHDLIQCVSLEGRFLYVNRAWLDTLGYTEREVPDLRVLDVVHPDSQEHCRQVWDSIVAGEPPSSIEAVFLAKDGTSVLVEGSTSCRFENDTPVSTRGIFRDVTERRRTQEELDRLFDLSLDLLCVAGTDGFFKQINPAFEHTLGYSREALLSRSFLEFVHPEDRDDTLAEVQNLATGHSVVDFRNRYRARDGSYRWLAWRSTPLADRGLIYAVARDITEQKRAEETMARQAAELSRSNADLERFAYAASHDLRAPLRTVAQLSDWIEEELPDDVPPSVRQNLNRLKKRVRRLDALTGDLLRYARAGQHAGEVAAVNTAELVRDVISLLEPKAGFHVNVKPGMPVLDTERVALEQVLRNLLHNAIKHHDRERGTIEISARDVGSRWEFTISDDGPGIAEEDRADVFEMFRTGRASDSEGSGMGLPLVQRIVERLGGEVRLDPGGARGTSIRFSWPKHVETTTTPDGSTQSDPSRR